MLRSDVDLDREGREAGTFFAHGRVIDAAACGSELSEGESESGSESGSESWGNSKMLFNDSRKITAAESAAWSHSEFWMLSA